MHMVAARLGCQYAMAGTGWANSCPGCMDRLRKHASHLTVAGKAACLGSKRVYDNREADYCMLVNEWAWSR